MPTASDEVRGWMQAHFGDPIDDSGPYLFLMRAGYTDEAGLLRKPADHALTEKEWHCIIFLCDEWDYGYEGEPQDGLISS